MKLTFKHLLSILAAAILCFLAPRAAHAGSITIDFTADYQTNGVGDVFSGDYTLDEPTLAAALAGSTSATIPITSFYLLYDGFVLNNGAAQAGSEVSLPDGGAGPLDLTLNGTDGFIDLVGIVDSSGITSSGCLTGVCTVDGLFNGNPGNPGYSQVPSPEPSSMASLAIGLGLIAGALWRKRRSAQ